MKKPLLLIILLAFSTLSSIAQNAPCAIIAHRGCGHAAPENTLSALRCGLLSGAQHLEIDVHQTLDSIVVLHHDETLDRCTDGTGRIDHHTYADLQKLDNGAWFSPEYAGEPIATLEQALDLVNGQCGLWIEIKGGKADYPGLERRIVSMIQARNAYGWVQIISFDGHALDRVHALDPKIRLQKLLVAPLWGLPLYLDKGLRWGNLKTRYPYVAGFDVFHRIARKSLIRRVHSWHKELNVWTVNKTDRFKKLFERGVDGITTDLVMPK